MVNFLTFEVVILVVGHFETMNKRINRDVLLLLSDGRSARLDLNNHLEAEKKLRW